MMKNSEEVDVIFALSSGLIRSALHLQRLSGKTIFQEIEKYLVLPSGKPVNLTKFLNSKDNNKIYYCNIIDEANQVIDDVVAYLYKDPHSFTGENTLEIASHGNLLILKKMQRLFRKLGFRDAKPGEFTQRAFLNGKLDLTQAEAINALIMSETEAGLSIARKSCQKELTAKIDKLKEEILEILAYLEANIDFDVSEVGNFDSNIILPKTELLNQNLIILFNSFLNGKKIQAGLRVAICGKPNAGKSTLFNSLLQDERAIVTEIPGTTRDVLSEKLVLNNRDFVLLDTAGIRKTSHKVELIGIEKAKTAISDADIILLILDISQIDFKLNIVEQLQNELHNFADLLLNKSVLVCLNKCDLISENNHLQLTSLVVEQNLLSSNRKMCCTAINSHEELINNLVNQYDFLFAQNKILESPVLISQRQADKVQQSLGYLQEAKSLLEQNAYPEIVASTLNNVVYSLAEILGEIGVEDVLGKLFSNFCIGK